MSTATKLQSILDSKASIKQALINRGYKSEEVGDILSQYGYLIENISTGGGELETAISDAKYDYIKEYLLDMITESYEITKDWVDYSQIEGSKTYLIPYIEGAIIDSNQRLRNSNILFFPSFINVPNSFVSLMCENCKLLIIADLDFSERITGINGYGFFKNCSSLYLCKGNVNLQSGQAAYMFYGCNNLEVIDYEFDFSRVSIDSTTFDGCTSLKELKLKGNTLNKGLNVSKCNQLSHDSLLSILNACIETDSTLTLTLGADNLAKLSEEEKAIATSKGWTLA